MLDNIEEIDHGHTRTDWRRWYWVTIYVRNDLPGRPRFAELFEDWGECVEFYRASQPDRLVLDVLQMDNDCQPQSPRGVLSTVKKQAAMPPLPAHMRGLSMPHISDGKWEDEHPTVIAAQQSEAGYRR